MSDQATVVVGNGLVASNWITQDLGPSSSRRGQSLEYGGLFSVTGTGAGYSATKRLKTKVLISPSGSGQMLPLPMNEFLQQSLADAWIDVDFAVLDWNSLISVWRAGAKDASSLGGTAMNYSYFIQDPFTGFIRHLQCNLAAPAGTNWGYYCDKDMDALFDQVRQTFDSAAQTETLKKIHEKYVDDALFLMVTHDVNARAMSPKVQGFVQAQNWFQNFSTITMTK